jgi:putative transposase
VLAQIYNREDRDHPIKPVNAFEADYRAKWPKAIVKITERIDVRLPPSVRLSSPQP